MGICSTSKQPGRDSAPHGTGDGKTVGLFARLPSIPLAFLGFGIYRAWIELAFVGSFVDFPATQYSGHDCFDLTILATALVFVAASRRLGTLYNRKVLYGACGISLIGSTLGLFASLYAPEYAATLAVPSAVLGGFGIALSILFWSELYCCLNPVRVALYFCASIVAGAMLIYICRGFLMPWLFAAMLIMPLASLACLRASFRSLPPEELPHPYRGSFSFPWKPILLMALFAFAYGLKESSLYASTFGPHSAFGTVVMASLVFVGVVFQGGKFDFRVIYRYALPLMVGTFLILPSLGFLDNAAADFCLTGAYTAFSILIMIILTSLSFRQGISAIWLFGIERAIRVSFNMLGRQTESLVSETDFMGGLPPDFVLNALVILLVAVLTMMLLTSKGMPDRWGVAFFDSSEDADESYLVNDQHLAALCGKVAKERLLSQREEEVLFLLAQRKSIGAVEKELVVAKGTAKTHIRNVYRKLDVHSRDELVEYLEMHD